MNKPILCLDFDGVIHSYTSGWKGADVISDPPVPGAIDFLREASQHFRVCVYSSRSHQPHGVRAMTRWLRDWVIADTGTTMLTVADAEWFYKLEWPQEKPPAHVAIDDRALTFIGEWPTISSLKQFEPWNKRLKTRT